MWHRHITGVLSAAECQQLISRGQEQGFEPAKVNHYGEQEMMSHVRNNDRVEFDDSILATNLLVKLANALVSDFPYSFDDKSFAKVGAHFRMYRYVPGQYFKTHKDGSFKYGPHESEITALFYLNDVHGGETVLMPYGLSQEWAHLSIQPRAGDVLLFEHNVWHEGRQVTSGEKYVLRTDLFYS
jgi:prolyl 4-hydroxylase